jgi:predicted Zn-dependent peptidase
MSLDRTQAPPFTLSADYSISQPEVLTLRTGQPLYAFRGLQQNVAKLELTFEAGKWYEPSSGTSYFTAQLIRKGTATRTSFAIAESLDRLGAHLEIQPGFDSVTVTLFVLSKNLFPAMDILLDILQQPVFPEEELRQEKEIFVQNLRVNNEKSSVVASRELRKSIYGKDHPYGNSTEEADVAALDSEQLRRYFQTRFQLHSAYFLGPVNDADLRRLTDRLSLPVTDTSANLEPSIVPGVSQRIAKAGSVQVSLRLGRRCIPKHDDASYYEAVMVNHVLGGFFGSRLMKNIREEKGLTYGIHSAMHHFRRDSFWLVSAEVNQQNAQAALDEIRKEIRALQEAPVSEDELTVARNYFIGSWQSDNATLFAVAEKIRSLNEFGLPADYYARMFDHLMAMTPVDVQAAARKHFRLDELLEVRVG